MSAALKKEQKTATVSASGGNKKPKTKKSLNLVSSAVIHKTVKDIDAAIMICKPTRVALNNYVSEFVGRVLNVAMTLQRLEKTKTVMPRHVRKAILIKVPGVEGEKDCIRAVVLGMMNKDAGKEDEEEPEPQKADGEKMEVDEKEDEEEDEDDSSEDDDESSDDDEDDESSDEDDE